MLNQRKASAQALLAALGDLTSEELLALADSPGELKKFCHALVAKAVQNTFAVALSDEGVRTQFPRFADRIEPWRKYAVLMEYRGPVAWRVKQGFTLKTHAPLVGFCKNNLGWLEALHFTEVPTTDCLAFWVPRLAKQSTVKTIEQMRAHRAEQQVHNLFFDHCDQFGSIQLLFALILAHFKRMGERVPLNCSHAASDNLISNRRLVVGDFGSDGLGCTDWGDQTGSDKIGFFLLGVEELSEPDIRQPAEADK